MKHIILLAAALAATIGTALAATGDSTHYLTPRDTVMLEIADDQSKFTSHVFEPKQTLYSLSRFYAQGIDQLIELNPELAHGDPNVGQQIKVAVPNVAITRFRTAGFSESEYAPVCYTVRQGETMYKIAKRIFRMPVDTLLAVNALSSTTLQPGQIIQVGWISVNGAADKIKPRLISPLERRSLQNRRAYAAQQMHLRPKRLVASWTPGTGDASGKLYALYGAVQPGTMLKVTNAANGRVAYVQVIGRPGASSGMTRTGLQLSSTTATVLGATEGNFYVKVE